MAKVSVMARLVAREGKGDELIAGFGDIFRQVEAESGTLVYALNRSAENPDRFWFYELYTDEAAFDAHRSSEVMAKAGAVLGGLVAESEIVVGAPVLAKGLDL
jgi:quinol monooxygenase YgiN